MNAKALIKNLSLCLISILCFLPMIAHAQTSDLWSMGQQVLIQTQSITLYAQPNSESTVVVDLPIGSVINLTYGPLEIGDSKWWYTDNGSGWIEEGTENSSRMIVFDPTLLDQIIENATQALQNEPEHTQSYLDRGLAYFFQKVYNDAIADFSHAIELNPESIEAFEYRGKAHYDQKDYLAAIEDYSRVLELQRDDAFTYNRRGLAFDHLNDFVAAVEDYNRAINLAPDYAVVYKQHWDYLSTCRRSNYGCYLL